MYSKKSKVTNCHRLPSLYSETLIKSESDYRREMRRKLDRLQLDNRDTVRRRHATDHLFAHEHLSKRYQWFSCDKSYRDNCRTRWNKQVEGKTRTSHVFLPKIYPPESPSMMKNTFEIDGNENGVITDEKIKQKFLYTQPVMLEILNAPHSSQVIRYKHELALRKQSAQRRQVRIQTKPMDDERYRQLVFSLQEEN